MAARHITFLVLLTVLSTLFENQVNACSCMPSHPQEVYCRSDFVIVARILSESPSGDYYTAYKANIKKTFKMSEKAQTALKAGKIFTALHGSMCGVRLTVGQVYLITGRVSGTQAHINLCGFTSLWRDVTSRQKKGFRLIYGRGCDCQIKYCPNCNKLPDKCNWSNYKCHQEHGICLRSPKGQCHWTKSQDLKSCLIGDDDFFLRKSKAKRVNRRKPKLNNPLPVQEEEHNLEPIQHSHLKVDRIRNARSHKKEDYQKS